MFFHLLKNVFLCSLVGFKGNRFHSWTYFLLFVPRQKLLNGSLSRLSHTGQTRLDPNPLGCCSKT